MATYVLTGGATGIGAAIKARLKAAGHRVVVLDLHGMRTLRLTCLRQASVKRRLRPCWRYFQRASRALLPAPVSPRIFPI